MYVRSAIPAIVQRILRVYHDTNTNDDIKNIEIFMLFTEYPSKSKFVLKELKKQDTNVYSICSYVWEYSVHYRESMRR